MSSLTFGTRRMPGPSLGPASGFPALREQVRSSFSSSLDEDEGLFLNYGLLPDDLPYTMQDNYDTEPGEQVFSTATLENEHLLAEFVLDLGARLWRLYDKDAQRELITCNDAFRPNNLAIRNAWFAGGIEYNIGRRGHDEQTCSPRFAAELHDDDGTPVLRIYEFDRDRAIPFQIDFYLPDGSRFLLARMRVMNTREEVVPMYWWSNIAVPQTPGARVVVPCLDTYANRYDHGHHALSRIPLPDGDGFDGTYPENFPGAKDYFFRIPEEQRKWEAVMRRDGQGLLFASTQRLQGRKLFVWGNCQGGKHWQRKLMGDGEDYLEIQGGLAHTQQECLPMPPRTTWEWLEAYGPVSAAPPRLFGDWSEAIAAVGEQVATLLPDGFLESELRRTRDSFALKAGAVRFRGSGWGALEEHRLGHRLVTHLDFGEPGDEQADWLSLLERGMMRPDSGPSGYLIQDDWQPLLKKARSVNWKTDLHLALMHWRRKDMERALSLAELAYAWQRNPWTTYVLAHLRRLDGQSDRAQTMFAALLGECRDDASLAKDVLRTLVDMGCDGHELLALCDLLAPEIQSRPMLQYVRAYALSRIGRLNEAETLLLAGGGLEIPDMREGERSVTDLYVHIQVERARREGREIRPSDVKVPQALDIRMS